MGQKQKYHILYGPANALGKWEPSLGRAPTLISMDKFNEYVGKDSAIQKQQGKSIDELRSEFVDVLNRFMKMFNV